MRILVIEDNHRLNSSVHVPVILRRYIVSALLCEGLLKIAKNE